ncbi:MAG: 4-hydroxyphenylpyruvate dioxygenase [Bdellovibrionales bacterium]|nr:4-hydroxyphenylpyruvate dioxygenase [Bdellovibrionales bacterium]
MTENPVGLDGMEFIEYSGSDAGLFRKLFDQLGMVEIATHKTKNITLFRQNDINFLLNEEPGTFASEFTKTHGPCVCSTGFRVKDAKKAWQIAIDRGAKPFEDESKKTLPWPTIYGIGDSLVYFVDQYGDRGNIYDIEFNYKIEDRSPKGLGFLVVDHMTNNVPKGELDKWAQFYEDVFNFREIRFFDIKGSQTGLLSRAMRSPCGKITIPINEPTEDKSQIQEYLDEYKGSGIQHIALLTNDICDSMKTVKGNGIPTLDVPDTYYEMLSDRVPNITEDMTTLKNLRLLADGDEEGYLLQIFTQNLIGPIFYEFIQRKNHGGFGEGNFQALFEAIERDQKRRGVL